MEQMHRILGPEVASLLERMGGCHDGMLNMTYVALASSRFVNGVAMQHGKISREMFPDYAIDAITNGVHAATWTAPPMQAIFDRTHSALAQRQFPVSLRDRHSTA